MFLSVLVYFDLALELPLYRHGVVTEVNLLDLSQKHLIDIGEQQEVSWLRLYQILEVTGVGRLDQLVSEVAVDEGNISTASLFAARTGE